MRLERYGWGIGIWTRETPWRQGHVLPLEAVNKLKFDHHANTEAACVVVVSHDCDLANHNLGIEPNVEVIVGCILDKVNGNFSWAKSPRTLHFEAIRDKTTVVIELVATAKCFISKAELAAFKPDTAWALSGTSISILRSWLAVRYNRAAFPDTFVDRLTKSKVKDGLAKLIEPMHKLLSSIYFDVDGGKEINRTDESLYSLKIVLVFPPGDEPEETADKIEELVAKIETLFAEKHFHRNTQTWSGVDLKACLAISEDDLPVSQARKLTEWRYEHMTLKEEGDSP